jgi:Ca2+-binding RTX toxin-like protein
MTNDNFDSAIRLIGFGDNSTGNNTGFTGEAREPILLSNATVNTAWWKYNAPSSGTLTIDTNGSNFNTVLGVYTGFSVDALTEVAFNDDGGVGNASLVSFTAVRDTTYFIAVDGFSSSTGNITLNLALTNATSGVSEDLIAIGDGFDNVINTIAGGANDVLDGRGGADTLEGAGGNDTYFVDNINDRVTNEDIDSSFDLVFSKSDHVLDTGVENLILAGFANLNGTGNNLDNGIVGNNGDNTLNGGAGFDVLEGGDGDDTLFGGDNDDILRGGDNDDILRGGDGDDILRGGDGIDSLDGGLGTDTITESGNVNFVLTNTTLNGLGIDTLISIESAILAGGIGNNTLNAISFNLGSVTLGGNGGDDLLIGGSQTDFLFGGDGNDTIAAKLGNDTVNGGNGTDVVTEKADVNFILTNGTLTGLGTDTLTSIESAILTGGVGNNTLSAIAFTLGSVTLNGASGNDVLRCGSGNDTLTGGLGNDSISGGSGIDTLKESGNVSFTLTNNSLTGLGTDTLAGMNLANLTGGVGNNSFNALAFTLGSVTLNGNAGNDVLRGGFANDFLLGGDGNDVLRGAGNNNGVGSIDTLTGNAGNDNFILSDSLTVFYNDGNNATSGLLDYALITDFNSAQDKIQLEGAANRYVLDSSAIAGITGTSIYLDTNGSGAFNSTDELIAVVQGSGGLSLGSSYFIYV